MALDKVLTPAIPEDGDGVVVDLTSPDATPATDAVSVDLADGGAEVTFGAESGLNDLKFDDNLAEAMTESALAALASELVGMVDADRQSRADWEKTYIDGLDLLGLKNEDRSTPWAGACGVFHPILAEAAIRFQAQTIMEVWPATGPAKMQLVGKIDDKKQAQAARVQNDLNWHLTDRMTEARSEHERLLFALPLAGAGFKKVYPDDSLGRPVSMFVPAEDFIVSYGATDLASCPRYTHVLKRFPNEIRKLQVAGFYRDVKLAAPAAEYSPVSEKKDSIAGESPTAEYDERHTLLEVHADLDLEGFEDPDEIALPYIVTIDKSSSTVLAVRRNWAEADARKIKRLWFVQYSYIPGMGFYGLGLIHLIGGIAKSATSILRQLVDAGTLSNLQAGFKTRGLRVKGDSGPLMPGEFRDVDVPSGSIRDALFVLPTREPSQVLAALLGQLVEEGRRFASIADLEIGDGNQEAPVGTTLALMERAMKVMSAVQARCHASMKTELGMLVQVIREIGAEYEYETDEGATRAEDYSTKIDVIPVSDPNATTMSQRVMQYQAALQLAAQAPAMYDMPELHRQMLGVLGMKEIDKIIPVTDEKKPMDPVSENMAILTGKPAKAFIYQDHEAHIQVHMTAMQDPKILALVGQSPNAPAIMAAAQAHIAEHVAFAYRSQIEAQMGVALPAPDAPLPEEVEVRLSRVVAEAGQRLLEKNQGEAQQKKNEEAAKDPIVQQAQQELAIKQGNLQRQAAKDAADQAAKAAKLRQDGQIALARLQQDEREANARLALERDRLRQQGETDGAQMGIDIEDSKAERESRERLAGVELGVRIAEAKDPANRPQAPRQ